MFFSLFKKITIALSGRGLWRVPGIAPLWTFIYKTFGPKGAALITTDQGIKMYVNPEFGYGNSILLTRGHYGKHDMELLKQLIKPGMVVVDIGAHMGYYSLFAARLVGDKGKIYAFEPNPNNYGLLVKNIEVNGYANITPIQKAVSNKEGKIKLFADTKWSFLSSLSWNNVVENSGFFEVEATTLDDFMNSIEDNEINILKIDAQGAEGLIVESAENFLVRGNLKILMEFWPYGLRNVGTDPAELLQRLKEYGYQIKLVDESNQYAQEIEIARLIETCQNSVDGMRYVDLLLEK